MLLMVVAKLSDRLTQPIGIFRTVGAINDWLNEFHNPYTGAEFFHVYPCAKYDTSFTDVNVYRVKQRGEWFYLE